MHAEAERNYYDSQIIILDTLKQVLNSVSINYCTIFQSVILLSQSKLDDSSYSLTYCDSYS